MYRIVIVLCMTTVLRRPSSCVRIGLIQTDCSAVQIPPRVLLAQTPAPTKYCTSFDNCPMLLTADCAFMFQVPCDRQDCSETPGEYRYLTIAPCDSRWVGIVTLPLLHCLPPSADELCRDTGYSRFDEVLPSDRISLDKLCACFSV